VQRVWQAAAEKRHVKCCLRRQSVRDATYKIRSARTMEVMVCQTCLSQFVAERLKKPACRTVLPSVCPAGHGSAEGTPV